MPKSQLNHGRGALEVNRGAMANTTATDLLAGRAALSRYKFSHLSIRMQMTEPSELQQGAFDQRAVFI
jgi:hypothetical protein